MPALLLGSCAGSFDPRPQLDADRCITAASRTGADLQSCQTDHFILLSSADGPSAASTGALLERMRQRFIASFDAAGFSLQLSPDRLVCVCLDSYQQLESYARLVDDVEASWMGGYYSYRTNRVAFVRFPSAARAPANAAPSASSKAVAAYCGREGDGMNLRTVTHEMTHQLAFNSGLQPKSVEYPFWATEGLATNFEADDPAACSLSRSDAGYMARLARAKAAGRLIPLAQFVAMTGVSSDDQAARDAYAQAWGLFHYLFLNRRPQLQQYMARWSPNQSPQRQFTDAFGPIAPLERDFQRFLAQQN